MEEKHKSGYLSRYNTKKIEQRQNYISVVSSPSNWRLLTCYAGNSLFFLFASIVHVALTSDALLLYVPIRRLNMVLLKAHKS